MKAESTRRIEETVRQFDALAQNPLAGGVTRFIYGTVDGPVQSRAQPQDSWGLVETHLILMDEPLGVVLPHTSVALCYTVLRGCVPGSVRNLRPEILKLFRKLPLELSSLITDYLVGNPERNQPRLHEAAKNVCRMTAVHGGAYLICAGVTNDV
jgi:hypothetical protein